MKLIILGVNAHEEFGGKSILIMKIYSKNLYSYKVSYIMQIYLLL